MLFLTLSHKICELFDSLCCGNSNIIYLLVFFGSELKVKIKHKDHQPVYSHTLARVLAEYASAVSLGTNIEAQLYVYKTIDSYLVAFTFSIRCITKTLCGLILRNSIPTMHLKENLALAGLLVRYNTIIYLDM